MDETGSPCCSLCHQQAVALSMVRDGLASSYLPGGKRRARPLSEAAISGPANGPQQPASRTRCTAQLPGSQRSQATKACKALYCTMLLLFTLGLSRINAAWHQHCRSACASIIRAAHRLASAACALKPGPRYQPAPPLRTCSKSPRAATVSLRDGMRGGRPAAQHRSNSRAIARICNDADRSQSHCPYGLE